MFNLLATTCTLLPDFLYFYPAFKIMKHVTLCLQVPIPVTFGYFFEGNRNCSSGFERCYFFKSTNFVISFIHTEISSCTVSYDHCSIRQLLFAGNK